ncbi:MAG TPA: sterol desaturase family protein [Ideonella sp.]|jgi:cyclopropane-fatty-acyl-phospholipid synthase|nr:sterol desaturase family protein [Ideonella sp.]
MGLLSLEQSKAAYRTDFALYGVTVTGLAIYLAWAVAASQRWTLVAWALLGLAGWTPIEYALHRFVLHGLPPFRAWHALHHARPTALVFAPTVLSGSLIGGVVFLPLLGLSGWWRACALTLGVLAGYLAYTLTHHAMHHGHRGSAWLMRRKRWHAQHHRVGARGCYGVTSAFWDRVCGTDEAPRRGATPHTGDST